jgi:hypothetical protein
MRLARPLLLALTCLVSAAPLLAVDVYIPLTRSAGFDDALRVTFEISAGVRNFGDTPRAFSASFIPAGTNGAQAKIPLGGQRLQPGQSGGVSSNERSPGLIVISGAPQISVLRGVVLQGSHITHISVSLTSVPAVRGDDGTKAGRTVELSDALPWFPDGSGVSDLAIVNLSQSPMRCTVSLGTITGGVGPVEPFDVSVPPISMAALQDVVGAHITGTPPESASATPQVRCDQQFFAAGYIYSTDSQENHSLKVSYPSVQLAP